MVELTKAESIKRIELRKSKVIDLTKDTPLEAATSRVALVLDYSGSMCDLYRGGEVQEVIERILPLSLKFDDNGELEFWIFDDDFKRLPEVTLDNFYGLTKRLQSKYDFGGTNYAPVLRDVYRKYVKEAPMGIPTYVIFITDGECFDRTETKQVLIEGSTEPVFIQFIGIGDENFEFLNDLDNMDGRYVDNANFFSCRDIADLSDDDLYRLLLQEYPQWLEYPEVKAMLKNYEEREKRAPIGGIFTRIGDKISDFINSLL